MKLKNIGLLALGIMIALPLVFTSAHNEWPTNTHKNHNVYSYGHNFNSENRIYTPINILSANSYARTIRVKIPNLHLQSNEQYRLFCKEDREVYNSQRRQYRSADVRSQLRDQPLRGSQSVQLEIVNAYPDTTYDCRVTVIAKEDGFRNYNAQYSEEFTVKTLPSAPKYHLNRTDGRRYNLASRFPRQSDWHLNRYVAYRPNVVVLRPQHNWNALSFGPNYYIDQVIHN